MPESLFKTTGPWPSSSPRSLLGHGARQKVPAAVRRGRGRPARGRFESVAANVEQKLSDIKLLTTEEEQRLLYGFNETFSEYPRLSELEMLLEEEKALLCRTSEVEDLESSFSL